MVYFGHSEVSLGKFNLIFTNPEPSSLGILMRPLIGGSLANPAEQYPRIFGSFSFLKHYPYFLPCFFSGFLALITALVAYLFLREVSA